MHIIINGWYNDNQISLEDDNKKKNNDLLSTKYINRDDNCLLLNNRYGNGLNG